MQWRRCYINTHTTSMCYHWFYLIFFRNLCKFSSFLLNVQLKYKTINSKLSNLEKGLPQDKAAPLFDKIVFDKVDDFTLLHLHNEIYDVPFNESIISDQTSIWGTSSSYAIGSCTFAKACGGVSEGDMLLCSFARIRYILTSLVEFSTNITPLIPS